jgi:hypothetical protein
LEEFAYLMAKLKAVPEGTARCWTGVCLLFLHEHAEANIHKNNGMGAITAGRNRLAAGRHTKVTGTIGDLYLALANGPCRCP